MKFKNVIKEMPLNFSYYLKTVIIKHNNRMVSCDMQNQLLEKLKYMPLNLRLMFLNLLCTGLRVSEVCAIKAGMYWYNGRDAWLNIYQNKLYKEKCIPIPYELYKLMKDFIDKNELEANDYVFQNKKGKAYSAEYFCEQLKSEFKKAGLTEYDFKSHDFRHTMASSLYQDYDVSIEVLRDFLGHRNSNMTKAYVDYIPEILDKSNEEYFADKDNKLII